MQPATQYRSTHARQVAVGPAQPAEMSPLLSLEWEAVILDRCNLLLEATPSAAEGVLVAMQPHLQAPVVRYSPKIGVPMPLSTAGTLILVEAGRLDQGQQTELCQWLQERAASPHVQIVSTSSQPLFPLVQMGTFAADLYYKLNIVRMDLIGAEPD